jgi:choline dehydrogenase-like flavoprotein
MTTQQGNHYDAIIVGSGAGGSAAAYKLARRGARVLLLEKGPQLPVDGSTMDVDKVMRQGIFKSKEPWLDKNGMNFVPEEYFNLGGKTKWYGAALLRFGPQEFEDDAVHQCLPWPIRYQELIPYYEEAEQLLGVREFEPEPDVRAIVGRALFVGRLDRFGADRSLCRPASVRPLSAQAGAAGGDGRRQLGLALSGL